MMPPWEADKWFQLPRETTKGVTPGSVNPLCTADPMRVGLIFGVPPTNTSNVGVSINPTALTNVGFVLSTSTGPIQLAHSTHGILVALQWFGIATGAGQGLTVTEIALRDWPMDDPEANDDVRDYIDKLGGQIKALSAQVAALNQNRAPGQPSYQRYTFPYARR
jgi:hypothetical protein